MLVNAPSTPGQSVEVFQTRDVDAVRQMLTNIYGRMRLTVTGGRHLTRLVHQRIGPLRLHHNTFRMRFQVDVDPLGTLAFCHVLSGQISRHSRFHGFDSGPGDVFLAAQPETAYRACASDVDVELAVIEPELLAQVAETAPDRSRAIRFLGYQPVSAQAAALWRDTYAYLRATLSRDPVAANQPLLTANAARLFAATVLTTFPNNTLCDPTIEDRHDGHPTTLRRAICFIDENAHREICVADIAAAAHVTIRALQLAFRRHLETTPMSYLRKVRLDHARRDLLNADPAVDTIGGIATRWGFVSHSRFTAAYRTAYGVLPSATLRRR
jgi:AraC-like DNA-binding protein